MELINVSDSLKKNNINLLISYITFEGISVKKQHHLELNNYIKNVKSKIIQNFSSESLKENEIIRRYREFYWHYLNIDPTKTRPSSEALIRRILSNNPIPQINNIVDLNNWVSIETLIPLGAYDMNLIKIPLLLRFANRSEEFYPIGGLKKKMKGNEIILSDKNNSIIHEYPHRDAEVSKIKINTKNMLVIACGVPGIEKKSLNQALVKFNEILEKISEKTFKSSEIYNFVF